MYLIDRPDLIGAVLSEAQRGNAGDIMLIAGVFVACAGGAGFAWRRVMTPMIDSRFATATAHLNARMDTLEEEVADVRTEIAVVAAEQRQIVAQLSTMNDLVRSLIKAA
jgi:outer membrane murein-binding lipoprotein Lpp